MLFGLVLALHILVSFVLIGVILLQGGRGGLSDALGGAAVARSLCRGGCLGLEAGNPLVERWRCELLGDGLDGSQPRRAIGCRARRQEIANR